MIIIFIIQDRPYDFQNYIFDIFQLLESDKRTSLIKKLTLFAIYYNRLWTIRICVIYHNFYQIKIKFYPEELNWLTIISDEMWTEVNLLITEPPMF